MGLTVYWTQFAEDKLNDVFAYLSENAGHKLAQKIIGQIIDKSLELEKNQYIGQKEPLLISRIHDFRYLVFNNYKIIYWVNLKKQRIEVVNIFDCRQNPSKMDKF